MYKLSLCVGPNCDQSDQVAELKAYVAEKGYPVNVTGAGCLQQCDYGPNFIAGDTLFSGKGTSESRGKVPQRDIKVTLDQLFGQNS